jgi:hypothetical protein
VFSDFLDTPNQRFGGIEMQHDESDSEWLRRMAEAEDQVGGVLSVGGIVATHMTPIHALERRIRERLPSVVMRHDPPLDPDNGIWFMDAQLGDNKVCVQGAAAKGFGLSSQKSSEEPEFGRGCDEVLRNDEADRLFLRVVAILEGLKALKS